MPKETYRKAVTRRLMPGLPIGQWTPTPAETAAALNTKLVTGETLGELIARVKPR